MVFFREMHHGRFFDAVFFSGFYQDIEGHYTAHLLFEIGLCPNDGMVGVEVFEQALFALHFRGVKGSDDHQRQAKGKREPTVFRRHDFDEIQKRKGTSFEIAIQSFVGRTGHQGQHGGKQRDGDQVSAHNANGGEKTEFPQDTDIGCHQYAKSDRCGETGDEAGHPKMFGRFQNGFVASSSPQQFLVKPGVVMDGIRYAGDHYDHGHQGAHQADFDIGHRHRTDRSQHGQKDENHRQRHACPMAEGEQQNDQRNERRHGGHGCGVVRHDFGIGASGMRNPAEGDLKAGIFFQLVYKSVHILQDSRPPIRGVQVRFDLDNE